MGEMNRAERALRVQLDALQTIGNGQLAGLDGWSCRQSVSTSDARPLAGTLSFADADHDELFAFEITVTGVADAVEAALVTDGGAVVKERRQPVGDAGLELAVLAAVGFVVDELAGVVLQCLLADSQRTGRFFR